MFLIVLLCDCASHIQALLIMLLLLVVTDLGNWSRRFPPECCVVQTAGQGSHNHACPPYCSCCLSLSLSRHCLTCLH